MLLEEFVLFQDYECTGVQMQYTYLPEFSDRLFSQSLLAYVLEGEVQYQREEKTLSVPRGDFIFFRDYVVLSTNDLPAALLGILFSEVSLENRQGSIFLDSSVIGSSDGLQSIRYLMAELVRTCSYSGSFWKLKQQSLCKDMVFQLLNNFYQPPMGTEYSVLQRFELSQDERRQEDFVEIMHMLDKKYNENIKLIDLAEAYYYTPSNFSKLFVKYSGKHFSEYLTELRLKKALSFLT